MTNETMTTVALLGDALRGERRATRRLVEDLTPIIRASVARTLLASRERSRRDVRQEVEDMTQTVFLCLFADGGRLLLRWDPARGLGLRSFVALLARRRTVAHLRTRRRNPWSEESTEHDTLDLHPAANGEPESIAVRRETVAALSARLRTRVSPRGAELFELLFLEERSTEDVCALTGLTPGAVYGWRTRLSSLAQEIGAELAA
jgi:RNA polymerase sigma-70 factor (ECF subfamily)